MFKEASNDCIEMRPTRVERNCLLGSTGVSILTIVKMYSGYDCDCCSDEDETILWGRDRALQNAVIAKDLDAAQSAIAAGANINAYDDHNGTILQSAALSGNEAIVRLLLSHGADVNARRGVIHGTALGAAAYNARDDNTAILYLLLEHGADPNSDKGMGCVVPPLQVAAEGVKTPAVRLLLEYGANVNALGGMYGTALQAACHYGYEPTVRVLLEAGADVNLKGGYHGDALQAAARYGRVQLVQMLLDAGADPSAQCGVYGSALRGAKERGHPEVAKILEEAIAKKRAKSDRGWIVCLAEEVIGKLGGNWHAMP